MSGLTRSGAKRTACWGGGAAHQTQVGEHTLSGNAGKPVGVGKFASRRLHAANPHSKGRGMPTHTPAGGRTITGQVVRPDPIDSIMAEPLHGWRTVARRKPQRLSRSLEQARRRNLRSNQPKGAERLGTSLVSQRLSWESVHAEIRLVKNGATCLYPGFSCKPSN